MMDAEFIKTIVEFLTTYADGDCVASIASHMQKCHGDSFPDDKDFWGGPGKLAKAKTSKLLQALKRAGKVESERAPRGSLGAGLVFWKLVV